jgi:hypothetical protein
MSMNNLETIYFIRDQMLTDPTLDAGFVWTIAKIAEEDHEVYTLMQEWMEEVNPQLKKEIENDIEQLLDSYMNSIINKAWSMRF